MAISSTSGTIQPIQRCQRVLSDLRMCPPSSCPAGNRFNEVANNPTHAARATGCSKMVLESAPGRINLSTFLQARDYLDGSLARHEFIKRLHRRFAELGVKLPQP